jgi:hypothetical protein
VVNDYSLASSWQDARDGRSPFHFLYGVERLQEQGFEITVISDQRFAPLAALDRRKGRLWMALGSLDRQAAAAGLVGQVDAIYAPCQTQIQALTYLSALGAIRAPIICLAHHPLVMGRIGRAIRPLVRLMLHGLEAMPTLSRAVADEANTLAGRPLARALPWGPDAAFYPPAEYPGTGILAAGRTGRDFATFGRAATAAGVPATILTLRSYAGPELSSLGPQVRVMTPDRFLGYDESTRMFAAARALAIPMLDQQVLCGLTSLMDALGAGKPVIMTRNAFIDLDIEKLGIGRWVEPGDVQGWIEALRFFNDNPEAAADMGRRARALVDGGLNYRSFSDEVVRIVRQAMASGVTS